MIGWSNDLPERVPERSAPVQVCPPRYRSQASLRASRRQCRFCGRFRRGPESRLICTREFYDYETGWEHE